MDIVVVYLKDHWTSHSYAFLVEKCQIAEIVNGISLHVSPGMGGRWSKVRYTPS